MNNSRQVPVGMVSWDETTAQTIALNRGRHGTLVIYGRVCLDLSEEEPEQMRLQVVADQVVFVERATQLQGASQYVA